MPQGRGKKRPRKRRTSTPKLPLTPLTPLRAWRLRAQVENRQWALEEADRMEERLKTLHEGGVEKFWQTDPLPSPTATVDDGTPYAKCLKCGTFAHVQASRPAPCATCGARLFIEADPAEIPQSQGGRLNA